MLHQNLLLPLRSPSSALYYDPEAYFPGSATEFGYFSDRWQIKTDPWAASLLLHAQEETEDIPSMRRFRGGCYTAKYTSLKSQGGVLYPSTRRPLILSGPA